MVTRDLIYCLMALPNWLGHNLHNSYGILKVFYIMWLRPLRGGLISNEHPFVTGRSLEDGELIWEKNVVYASKRKREFNDSDSVIVKRIMKYLSRMVENSSATTNHPYGKKNRMPPAVNYIHGTVHFNGASLIFDDFKDALEHFTDRRFYRDFLKMVMLEKREPTIIFRDRDYDPDEFAVFSCFMKTRFPFFGNPNGNKKRLHWGTPSPQPAFNLIVGWWIAPTLKLRNEKNHTSILRPAIVKNKYLLRDDYGVLGRREYLFPELIWSKFTNYRIQLRGERGGMYFTDKRKVDNGFLYDPSSLITLRERMMEKIFGISQ
ncbi:hypothetical protein [Halobacteriovorax sp. JY17]|uniref:hypothetical protein n=1 Tax=Halobacteriovorax sp. JY17 TaxID=2014617 RepID=UPI000C53168A|nr:hypothetical protein [Halobacteriovorax sp. JY17]PIK13637.1 MAG: hypothetical protein CES88_15720 [Halobacteriovorax sp. JY17]